MAVLAVVVVDLEMSLGVDRDRRRYVQVSLSLAREAVDHDLGDAERLLERLLAELLLADVDPPCGEEDDPMAVPGLLREDE